MATTSKAHILKTAPGMVFCGKYVEGNLVSVEYAATMLQGPRATGVCRACAESLRKEG